MGRRPQAIPSRRCYITLEAADAELLYAEAKERGKPVATVAAHLLVERLRGTVSGTDIEDRQRLASPHGESVVLRPRPHGNGVRNAAGALPRWEWPIEDILADRAWWTTWLPRLHELLGRRSARYTLGHGEPRDHRGYVDVLAFLFPPVEDEGRAVEWHHVDYARQARRHEQAKHRDRPAIDARAGPPWAIWEPVIRHVVVGLAALEMTAAPGADPILHIRTDDELAGAWLRTLRRLTGDEAPELPQPSL